MLAPESKLAGELANLLLVKQSLIQEGVVFERCIC